MKGVDPNFKPDASIASQIDSKHNAFADDPSNHNLGQPIHKNSIEKSSGKHKSKFLTNCQEQHSNSLKCIEENYEDRSVCQPFFDVYKKCRKEEHQKKLEMNAKMSGKVDGEGCVIC